VKRGVRPREVDRRLGVNEEEGTRYHEEETKAAKRFLVLSCSTIDLSLRSPTVSGRRGYALEELFPIRWSEVM
jgi:hypothetical protein